MDENTGRGRYEYVGAQYVSRIEWVQQCIVNDVMTL